MHPETAYPIFAIGGQREHATLFLEKLSGTKKQAKAYPPPLTADGLATPAGNSSIQYYAPN